MTVSPERIAQLSPRALQVFLLVQSYPNAGARRLSEYLKCSEPTVFRAIRELKKHKLIATQGGYKAA